MAITTNDIIQYRNGIEKQHSARQARLAELMRRYLQAREVTNRALNEVRTLQYSLREEGDHATEELTGDYKRAILRLNEFRHLSSRFHTDLLDALARGYVHHYINRRTDN